MTALFANALNAQNPIFDSDSYKFSHAMQYPEGTEIVSSYIEPRSGWAGIDHVLFFGLQIELAKMAAQRITQAMINEAAPVLQAHGLSLYLKGWQHIVDQHNGRLPLLIEALPEGTIAPISVPQMRVQNTDPACWWLPSFMETRLLRAVWYPSTVATLSNHVISEIRARMLLTDGSDEGVEFKLHDFGARGASSFESAAIGGLAHLVSAMGTDTTPALIYARNFYGADMAGFSIPATEHSTMTALGKAGELAQMRALLAQNPRGLLACVSDSYDMMRAVNDYWGDALREQVLARDGVLIVRPDSGDPMQIVPEVIEALMARFGHTTTAQGYKLLHEKVRVIQGDGVTRFSIVKIMDELMRRGLAIGNIAFGMGAGLLQKLDRDNFSYTMKASANYRGGAWVDVHKDPVTAGGSKTSKRGRQGAMLDASGVLVARRVEDIPAGADALQPVFQDGELLNVQTLDEVRAQARRAPNATIAA